MALKDLFEGNTSKVIEATELLKVLGDREGQFVWKKCDGVKRITLTQTTDSANPTILQVVSYSTDLSTVDATWFVGIKGYYTVDGVDYDIEFLSSTEIKINQTTATFTYTPATAQISIAFSLSTRTWTVYPLAGDVVGYNVADSEDAYPDGGMLDGYWYEIHEAPSLAELTADATATAAEILKGFTAYADGELLTGTLVKGVTGVAFGTVTASSTSTNIVVSHGLGGIPTYAALLPKDGSFGSKGGTHGGAWNMNGKSFAVGLNSSYEYDAYSTSISKTSSKVTFGTGFEARTYCWIVWS